MAPSGSTESGPQRARRWRKQGLSAWQIVQELAGRTHRPCRAPGHVSINGQGHFPIRCTLPAGHGPWHEWATPAGVVHYVWGDPGADLGKSFPYKSLAAMETGPYQTARLGRWA